MNRDLGNLQIELTRLLSDGERITGIKAFSTGHSNETYLIEGLDQILRLPPSANPLIPDTHSVPMQAKIYEAVAQAGGDIPVPDVLYRSDETAPLGDPFFIMARASGEEINDYQPQNWFKGASPADRDAMCLAWMNVFSGLANLPLLDILGPPVTPEDEIARWRGLARQANCARLIAQFDRLLATPAPRTGEPSLVHGDPKLANLMWENGRLTAVLDWELAYNGEPLADLGYMLFFFASDDHSVNGACRFPGMWTRDKIITCWSDTTGRSASGVRWHEIGAIGKMASILAYGHHLYASGKSDDVRFDRWKGVLDTNLDLMEAMLDSI